MGASGSIGRTCLDVIRDSSSAFTLFGLSVHSNVAMLQDVFQDGHMPSLIVLTDSSWFHQKGWVRSLFPKSRCMLGFSGLNTMLEDSEASIVVNAISGFAGFLPSLQAICSGKDVFLANKEGLVAGGAILLKEAKQRGVRIVPLDSEHSALLFLMRIAAFEEIDSMILTASGGPFYFKTKSAWTHASVEDVLQHPTWKMGAKISVESALLLNKGFEVLEAQVLFGLPLDKIQVLIHPQSFVHALIRLVNGVYYSQMSSPDMYQVIKGAFDEPEIKPDVVNDVFGMNLGEDLQTLNFYRPDTEKFPLLALALEIGRLGGDAPCAFVATSQVAVNAFLSGMIQFGDIETIVLKMLSGYRVQVVDTANDVVDKHDCMVQATESFIKNNVTLLN